MLPNGCVTFQTLRGLAFRRKNGMSKTVVGLFNTVQQAENTVNDLVSAGVARDQINVIAKDTKGVNATTAPGTADSPLSMGRDMEEVEKGETVTQDTMAGALFGGAGGALIGVLALAIPGLGPLVAAGPIAATLAGMVTGAVGGAAIGAFEQAGISKEDAHIYAESLKRGNTVVAVHTDDSNVAHVRDLLDKHGAMDVDARAEEYRSGGWSGFDHTTDEPVLAGRSSNTAQTLTDRDVASSETVERTNYVGETDRSLASVSTRGDSKINPTDTTIMTSPEVAPHSSRQGARIYDHTKS